MVKRAAGRRPQSATYPYKKRPHHQENRGLPPTLAFRETILVSWLPALRPSLSLSLFGSAGPHYI
jgi:hypothetical protein